MNITAEQFQTIHTEAFDAAQTAAKKSFAEELYSYDNFPCGFSWVEVYGVKLNTKLGKAMAAVGFEKSYSKGIVLWNPSRFPCKNVDTLYAASNAYAEVLKKYGIEACANFRWD